MADSEFFKDLEVYRNTENLNEFYDKYAKEYDVVMGATGVLAIQEYAAKLLKEKILVESPLILDIGCGTGLCGVNLKNVGFGSIHGTDPSANSLKCAEEKNVYSQVFTGIITGDQVLPCKDNTYDGVTCISTITKGHLQIQPAVEEFCRIVKPGGYAIFTINDVSIDPNEFMGVLGAAMKQRKMEIALMEKKFHYKNDVKGKECYCCLIRVL